MDATDYVPLKCRTIMQLLDLPLEVFHEIIHIFVRDAGFVYAIKARHVNKIFAHVIHHDISARHPISTFRALSYPRRRDLMLNILPDVLFSMKSPKCGSNYLHKHMDATIEYMHLHFPHISNDRRTVYKKQLCKSIAAALPCEAVMHYLHRGAIAGSPNVYQNMAHADKQGMLAAAAAVGNINALASMIGKVRRVRTYSRLYGSPLLAAAVNGQVQAAATIYQQMQLEGRSKRQLWHVIKTCLKKRCTAMLPTLLVWYHRLDLSLGHIYSTKRFCAEHAVRNGWLDVLCTSHLPYQRLQARHAKSRCHQPYDDFGEACRYGHEAVVRFYMSKMRIHRCKHTPTYNLITFGLHVAAKNGRLVVAKLLLDSGAQINSLVALDGRDTRTALARAVAGKHMDMVVLLLTYGASVALHDPRAPMWTTEALACMQGGTMWKIIRQAKQTEMGQIASL